MKMGFSLILEHVLLFIIHPKLPFLSIVSSAPGSMLTLVSVGVAMPNLETRKKGWRSGPWAFSLISKDEKFLVIPCARGAPLAVRKRFRGS